MPTMVTIISSPAITQASAIHTPPRISQSTFRNSRIRPIAALLRSAAEVAEAAPQLELVGRDQGFDAPNPPVDAAQAAGEFGLRMMAKAAYETRVGTKKKTRSSTAASRTGSGSTPM